MSKRIKIKCEYFDGIWSLEQFDKKNSTCMFLYHKDDLKGVICMTEIIKLVEKKLKE